MNFCARSLLPKIAARQRSSWKAALGKVKHCSGGNVEIVRCVCLHMKIEKSQCLCMSSFFEDDVDDDGFAIDFHKTDFHKSVLHDGGGNHEPSDD